MYEILYVLYLIMKKIARKKNHSTHCTQLFIELINILQFNFKKKGA